MLAPLKFPLRTSVMYGTGGRMLTVARRPDSSLLPRALNLISPEPSSSVTRNLKTAVCSRPAAMHSSCLTVPTNEKLADASARRSISASESRLFATVTPASNSSPGATNTGTLGVITNGPRISASQSVDAAASSATATAIIFRVPSKKSGTW